MYMLRGQWLDFVRDNHVQVEDICILVPAEVGRRFTFTVYLLRATATHSRGGTSFQRVGPFHGRSSTKMASTVHTKEESSDGIIEKKNIRICITIDYSFLMAYNFLLQIMFPRKVTWMKLLTNISRATLVVLPRLPTLDHPRAVYLDPKRRLLKRKCEPFNLKSPFMWQS